MQVYVVKYVANYVQTLMIVFVFGKFGEKMLLEEIEPIIDFNYAIHSIFTTLLRNNNAYQSDCKIFPTALVTPFSKLKVSMMKTIYKADL